MPWKLRPQPFQNQRSGSGRCGLPPWLDAFQQCVERFGALDNLANELPIIQVLRAGRLESYCTNATTVIGLPRSARSCSTGPNSRAEPTLLIRLIKLDSECPCSSRRGTDQSYFHDLVVEFGTTIDNAVTSPESRCRIRTLMPRSVSSQSRLSREIGGFLAICRTRRGSSTGVGGGTVPGGRYVTAPRFKGEELLKNLLVHSLFPFKVNAALVGTGR